MAKSAAAAGAAGIFAMPPVYFKPMNIDDLVNVMAYIAAAAPESPFWYYHFPQKTGVDFNMFQFVEAVDKSGKIPNFMGIKFTNEMLIDLTAIGFWKNRKYQMLMGRDEELTGALATGAADADVSSTINFMSYNLRLGELYNKYDKDSRDQME
jgi:N-acetylneuraminate lyase